MSLSLTLTSPCSLYVCPQPTRELEAVRPAGAPVFLSFHHPLLCRVCEEYYFDNEFALLDVIAGHNVKGLLVGHEHANGHWYE